MKPSIEQIETAIKCICHGISTGDCEGCYYNRPAGHTEACYRGAFGSDVLALIKELTEENERLRAENIYGLDASALAKKVEELSYENDRLRNRVVAQIKFDDEKLEEIKNECLERVELDIKAIRADTVQKYKSAIIEYYSKPKYQPTKEQPIKHTQIEFLFAVLDQIAKELLGNT